MVTLQTPIDERNYNTIMQTQVEPFLAAIRKDGTFITTDGKRIHYEAHLAEKARGAVVIFHGFTESAEKFREMAYYFVQNGLSAFALDHRGHGESDRIPGDPETVRLNDFDDYIRDANVFVRDVVKPHTGDLPLYLYAHSMGGAIGGRYIQEYPDDFAKAILSSPMICANTGMPIPVAKALAAAMCAVGLGNASVPGRCHFNENETVEDSDDTSEARFLYYHEKQLKNPALRTSGPSFRWVKEAMAVTDKLLDENNCGKVSTKVLIFQPQTDRQVLSPYQNKFAAKLRDAKLIFVPGAKHEIYASTNDVLQPYLEDIFTFLG